MRFSGTWRSECFQRVNNDKNLNPQTDRTSLDRIEWTRPIDQTNQPDQTDLPDWPTGSTNLSDRSDRPDQPIDRPARLDRPAGLDETGLVSLERPIYWQYLFETFSRAEHSRSPGFYNVKICKAPSRIFPDCYCISFGWVSSGNVL